MSYRARTERWTKSVDDHAVTAVVDVLSRDGYADALTGVQLVEGSEYVEVSYELLTQMLADLGYTLEAVDA
jgi:hypothetical protein